MQPTADHLIRAAAAHDSCCWCCTTMPPVNTRMVRHKDSRSQTGRLNAALHDQTKKDGWTTREHGGRLKDRLSALITK